MFENTLKMFKEMFGDVDTSNVAMNIREDAQTCQRRNSENVIITGLKDNTGLKIHVLSSAKGEEVFIPAIVTKSNITDEVRNDFYIDSGAEVIIQAGCALHTDGNGESTHNGNHHFYIGEGAKVTYNEKHFGEGTNAKKTISPSNVIVLEKNAYLKMDTIQTDGVSYTNRTTKATVKAGARLEINERIQTQNDQQSISNIDIDAIGDGASIDIVSRSVAKDDSVQTLKTNITANSVCTGHSECDTILVGNGKATSIPALVANNPKASLVHEAAIGRISQQQIEKLQTLGLDEEEAEHYIIKGFLR